MYAGSIGTPSYFAQQILSNDTGDIYYIRLQRNLAYDVDLLLSSPLSDFEIRLVDKTGVILLGLSTSASQGVSRSLDFVWTYDIGYYYIFISKESGVGAYALKIYELNFGDLGSQGYGNSPVGQDLLQQDSWDMYAISLSQNNAYDVNLYNYPSTADFEIQLLAANGTVYYSSISGYGESVSIDFVWTKPSGYYYIRVVKQDGSGIYTLSVRRMDLGNPGDSIITNEIVSSDSWDIWGVNFAQYYSYDVDLTAYPSSADFEIEIMAANGTIYYFTNSGFGQDVSADFVWTKASGYYYIKVVKEVGYGQYRLRCYKADIGDPGSISVQGRIISNDSWDIWRIYLRQYYSYDINLLDYPSTADFEMQLLYANGTLIQSSSSDFGEDVSLDLIWTKPTDSYCIKVLKESGIGAYTISALRLDLGNPGENTVTQEMVSNDLCDIWRIYLDQYYSLDADLVNLPSSADFKLQLVGRNGTVFFSSASGQGKEKSLDFVWIYPSDYYYLKVLRVSGFGGYTLKVCELNIDRPSTSGNSYVNSLLETDNQDIWRIYLDQGCWYDAELRVLPSNAKFELSLVNANGQTISNLATQSNVGETVSLDFRWNTTSGVYYISVLREIGSGPYTLYAYKNDLGHPANSRSEASNRFIANVDKGDIYAITFDKDHWYALTLDVSEGLTIAIINGTTGTIRGGPFPKGTSRWLCPASGIYVIAVQKSNPAVVNLYSLYVEEPTPPQAINEFSWNTPMQVTIFMTICLFLVALTKFRRARKPNISTMPSHACMHAFCVSSLQPYFLFFFLFSRTDRKSSKKSSNICSQIT
jgi:hypothetical protein